MQAAQLIIYDIDTEYSILGNSSPHISNFLALLLQYNSDTSESDHWFVYWKNIMRDFVFYVTDLVDFLKLPF